MVSRALGIADGPLFPMVNVVKKLGPRDITLAMTPLGGSEAWLTWSGNAILERERERERHIQDKVNTNNLLQWNLINVNSRGC